MTNVTMYGIKNCDTMKKAFDWLSEHQVSFTFHDYKTKGISKTKLEEWLKHFDLWKLLNTKSSTWRETSDTEKAGIQGKEEVVKYLLEKTSAIKRPVLEFKGGYLLGFDPIAWKKALE